MNVPDAVGVPLIVMVLAAQVAVTPAGSPVAVPIPVAPVVICVIAAVNAVLIQIVGVVDGNETVLSGFTVMVPVDVNGVLTTGEPAATLVNVYVVVEVSGVGVFQVNEPAALKVTL